MRIHPDTPDAGTVKAAAASLRPEDPPAWGRMSAPRMLEHCARFHEVYLGRRPTPLLVRVLGRLVGGPFIRRFLARSPLEMPRGMRTLPGLQVDGADDGADDRADEVAFTAARDRFLATFDEIEARSGTWDHPLYGRIDAEVGKALARHHAAHHLHQFGKL